MQYSIKAFLLMAAVVAGLGCDRAWALEESSFCRSLVPVKYILDAEPGSWNWGMAPIYDDTGKLHVFNSVIPDKGRWVINSRIAHWTADHPEGPYTLLGDVFGSDEAAYHNPQISRVGDSYVLVFLLNRHRDENGSKQEVGLATATSLEGPWTESPHNPVVKATEQNGGHASNPSLVVAPDGQFRMYYKTLKRTKAHPKGLREISLATSDTLEGPYTVFPHNPVISYADQGVDIEDPYAFYYQGLYYMILEDRSGVANRLDGKVETVRPGGWRPGLLYRSRDGVDWGKPKMAYQTNTSYFGEPLARSERPGILWKHGEPEYLFLACHDDKPSAGYMLRIVDWESTSETDPSGPRMKKEDLNEF